MKTRKDAVRPRVRCPECRWFDEGGTLCQVARKVFVVRGTLTCQRYKPARVPRTSARKPSQTQTQTQADPKPMKSEQDSTPPATAELQALLLLEGLEGAVAEMQIDEHGRVWVRFAAGVDVETMNQVGRLVCGGSF